MGLETSTFINGLVATNPTGTDGRAQGDDHIRLIKKTLKNTFPNVAGEVKATQDQLNLLATGGATSFKGQITMYSGAVGDIPAGWKVCDGTNGTPDLRDKFILGAGLSAPLGFVGGSSSAIVQGNVSGTSLTIDQIPPHTHDIYADDLTGAGSGGNPDAVLHGNQYVGTTRSAGGGQPHTHHFAASVPTLPPYMALLFIMKVS